MAKSASRKHSIVAKAKCAAQPVKKSKRTAAAASSSCWHHDGSKSENSWKKFARECARGDRKQAKGYRPKDTGQGIQSPAARGYRPRDAPKKTAGSRKSVCWNDWSHATTNSKWWNAKQRWPTSSRPTRRTMTKPQC